MAARRLEQLSRIPVTELKGVGAKTAGSLDAVGVETVLDLLTYYPRRYIDRTKESALRDLAEGEEAMALVQIESLKPANDATGAFEPAAASPDSTRPERLGEYRILREVGRGGMGVVYEAEQVSLGRRVALKVLPPHALLNPTYLERFRREAKAAAKLHHTNIVPVFGVGEEEGVHFYAMQFIRGEGLDRVLHDLRRLRHAPGGAVLPTGSVASERSVAHGLLAGEFAEPATVRAEIPGGPADRLPAVSGTNPPVSSDWATRLTGRDRGEAGAVVPDGITGSGRSGSLAGPLGCVRSLSRRSSSMIRSSP